MQDSSATKPHLGSRLLWHRIHLWIGWVAALPIALVCLSGALLIFEKPLFRFEHREFYQLDVTGAPLSVEAVLEAYQAADPPLRVNHLVIPESADHSYSAYCSELHPEGERGARVFLDPYSGELTWLHDEFSLSRALIVLHRQLAAGRIGQQVVAGSSLLLAVTCILGLLLWWPMRRRTFRRILRRGRVLDWHNAMGLLTIAPLIAMAITGITFTWGNNVWNLLGKSASSSRPEGRAIESPATSQARLPVGVVVKKVQALMPEATWTGFQPSNHDAAPHKFFFKKDGKEHLLRIDPHTGDQLPLPGESKGVSRLVGWYRTNFGKIHTLEFGALPVRLVWGACALGGTVLVLTGLTISTRRRRKTS